MPKTVLLFLCCLGLLESSGQIDSSLLRAFFQTNDITKKIPDEVARLYRANQYEAFWFSSSSADNLQQLQVLIADADTKGLDGKNSSYAYVKSFQPYNTKLVSKEDSLAAELLFTEAFVNYVHSLTGLQNNPKFQYEGFKPETLSPIDSLACLYLKEHKLYTLIDNIQPGLKEIYLLEAKLKLLLERQGQFSPREQPVTSKAVTYKNTALANKLFLLGIIDSLKPVSDPVMKQYVQKAQVAFNLLNDGTLRSTILDELNISIAERIRRLILALEYYRWLHFINLREPVIVVNIPSATLSVYRNDSVQLQMRMIVGKPATPTPTLTSRVSEIIFYPYWNVPHNIAVHEMLPSIKENRRYIDANNLQVLDKNGRILDPDNISWGKLSAANFPYHIRQSTGCDNALGIVKMNFYNPFSVYLHDTPVKSLFMLNKRYFSHGCMRMEQPMELVSLALNNRWPSDLDTTVCLEDQRPITLPAAVKMPVVVWYNPAGIDKQGNIVFYEDVYHRFKKEHLIRQLP